MQRRRQTVYYIHAVDTPVDALRQQVVHSFTKLFDHVSSLKSIYEQYLPGYGPVVIIVTSIGQLMPSFAT